jgi:hypothetical protein
MTPGTCQNWLNIISNLKNMTPNGGQHVEKMPDIGHGDPENQ